MREPASIKDLLATSHRKTSSGSRWGSAFPRTTILHLNVRPIEGVKWSTIQVQESTIYPQSALQLNRRLRGRGAHFWSTIYLQSTPIKAGHQGSVLINRGSLIRSLRW